VAAPQRAALRLRAVGGRQAVSGLDQRVDAVRVRARDLHGDLPDRRGGQAVAGEARPGRAAVDRLEHTAAGTAAGASPGVDLDLPHAGERQARVAGVTGAVDAALLLRTVGVAERAGQHDVRIARVDDDAADPPRRVEAAVRPRLAGVCRLVDAVADRDVAADERFAGAGPDDVRVRRRDRQRADRGHRLVVE